MLYTLSMHLYNGALRLAALRNAKARDMMAGRRLTLPALEQTRLPAERWVWLHAASLGEFEQGRPLLERLRREHPELKICLTFYSPSGYNVRRNWSGADLVLYLPADTPAAMRRFLSALRPEVAVIVKYEFWGNMLAELKKKGIPTLLISAIFRPGQIFFRPWGGRWSRMLRSFERLYVQDEQSKRLLADIDVENVEVVGDTRFDRVTDILAAAKEIPELEAFTQGGNRLTIMFGSSWPQDEQHYIPWLKSRKGKVKAVIAPHEFDPGRLKILVDLLSPLRTVLMSEVRQKPALLSEADVLIIDCFGLLSSAYRYASVAYVGGGFGAGLHNINEAAVYSIPVVYGPNNHKFLEAQELKQCGGGLEVTDSQSVASALEMLSTPSARKRAGAAAGAYIRSRLGATDKIYPHLLTLLWNRI